MTEGVKPVGGVEPDRRSTDRRANQRRANSKALVPISDPVDHPAATAPVASADAAAAFSAQLMGQTGQRKGLKGGPPVLDAARSTYLSAEYSGANDRRPPKGKAAKTEV